MKSLSIPHLPVLKSISLEQAISVIDEDGTRFSVETLNWPKLFGYKPITFVSAAHDGDNLYLYFQVHGNCLRAATTQDNGNVHEDSCVEFFVRPTDSDVYFNFEFNCAGVCKAARHFGTREAFEYLSSEDMKSIGRWSSMGNRAFNEIYGMFSWELAVKIPFRLMDLDPERLPASILGNFYKCADATCQPHYVTWNPVSTERPDFHRPEFFGKIFLI